MSLTLVMNLSTQRRATVQYSSTACWSGVRWEILNYYFSTVIFSRAAGEVESWRSLSTSRWRTFKWMHQHVVSCILAIVPSRATGRSGLVLTIKLGLSRVRRKRPTNFWCLTSHSTQYRRNIWPGKISFVYSYSAWKLSELLNLGEAYPKTVMRLVQASLGYTSRQLLVISHGTFWIP